MTTTRKNPGRIMRYRCILCLLTAVFIPSQVMSRDDAEFFQSRLASLAAGPFSENQWNSLMREMQEARERALGRGDRAGAVALGIQQARAYYEIRHDAPRALALLEKLKVHHAEHPLDNVRELFLTQARIYAALGNPQAINRLIIDFRNNPNYDGRFSYRVREDPEPQLVVTRPRARGSESITIAVLENLRRQALAGVGQEMPAITVTDRRGNDYLLTQLPWELTLVDLWHGAFINWQRNMPYLVQTYADYQRHGFSILGISMDRDPAPGWRWLRQQGARWPQAAGTPELARQLGLYGEPANMLVDSFGNILARNVAGPDLAALVREVLGVNEP